LQIDVFIAQFGQIINTSEYVAHSPAKGSSFAFHHHITMVVVKEVWALVLTSMLKKSKKCSPENCPYPMYGHHPVGLILRISRSSEHHLLASFGDLRRPLD
jgi:hypothetical protein